MTTKKASTASKAQAGPAAFELPQFEDFENLLQRYQLPGVDVAALADWQRKDLETIAEAHRQAYEGIKAIVERRNEMLKETLAQWQSAMQDPARKDALTKQAEAAEGGIRQAIDNFNELSQMNAEVLGNTWKVLQDRLQENTANLQKLLQPK